MIKAVVVGLGWWGHKILATLHGNKKIKVVMGVDVDPGRRTGLIEQYGLRLESSLETALAEPEIEAVIIATPHSQHEEQVLAAVTAGKQVFCEKPLTLTGDGARRILSACDRAGIILGIGHERRYEAHFEAIEERLRAGSLGTLLHVEANFSHDRMRTITGDNWRALAKDSPAAGMSGMGIHLTDAFINLLGPIAEVHAITARRVLDLPTGDVISVHMCFNSGATGYMAAMSATPFYGRFTVFGDQGWLEGRDTAHVEDAKPSQLVACDASGERDELTLAPVDAVRANFEAWTEAVRGSRVYRFTNDQILQNIAALEAIVASAESGRPEPVNNRR